MSCTLLRTIIVTSGPDPITSLQEKKMYKDACVHYSKRIIERWRKQQWNETKTSKIILITEYNASVLGFLVWVACHTNGVTPMLDGALSLPVTFMYLDFVYFIGADIRKVVCLAPEEFKELISRCFDLCFSLHFSS